MNYGHSNTFDDGKAPLVITKLLADLPGGATLNLDGFQSQGDALIAGHVILQDPTTGVCSPLPLNDAGNAYANVPEGKKPIGILTHSIFKDLPQASVMTIGQARKACLPFPLTDALESALSRIQFI